MKKGPLRGHFSLHYQIDRVCWFDHQAGWRRWSGDVAKRSASELGQRRRPALPDSGEHARRLLHAG